MNNLKGILFFQRLPNTIFALQNHTPRFQALQRMPLTHRDTKTADVASGFNKDGVGKLTLVVIIEPLHLATKHHNGLRSVLVTVDGHHCTRLQGVEHTLALVFRTVAHVVVHSQPQGGFRLCSQGVEEFLINQHLKCRVESQWGVQG